MLSIDEKIKRCGARIRGDHPQSHPRSFPVCPHLGEATGEVVRCPSCRGSVELKVFQCAKHGLCTIKANNAGLKSCSNCPDHPKNQKVQEFPKISKTNLLYYVYPVSGNGAWQRCIDRISPFLHQFNGKIVFCVSQDPKSGRVRSHNAALGHRIGNSTDSTAAVENRVLERASGLKNQISFLEVENNVDLWESAHHKLLFSQVLSTDPSEATLYAHAKGVTRPPHSTVHRWYDVLIETLVQHAPVALDQLTCHPCTGSFKKLGRGFARSETNSQWHYSGSFCWYRHDALFARDWQKIDRFWAAIESYPSVHFNRREAGCVFHEGPVNRMNLYDRNYWNNVVEPQLSAWRALNSSKMKLLPVQAV